MALLRKQSLNCSKRSRTSSSTLSAIPDSTTKDKEMSDFSVGLDVLLKQKDGRYYLGTVVEVDSIREQCLLRFGDNTESWANFKGLSKLSASEQDDVLCVMCKMSMSLCKQIIVCDKCGRGYHPKCHEPEIPTSYQKKDTTWICNRCKHYSSYKLRRQSGSNNLRNSLSERKCEITNLIQPRRCSLPYELESLHWDTYHRFNVEQMYCYCAKNGEWYKQMLQCIRCKQWFHGKCIHCLQYPLYCGDRFYIFVCLMCNHGQEFLRRLEMKWVDLVHLILFNLTAFNSKKYFDLDNAIIPYVNDNWHFLNLPQKLLSVNVVERREYILNALTSNRNRFKCGKEIKRRTTIWGLRVRLPPPVPNCSLPFNGFVTEQILHEMWQGNRRLQFIPLIKTDEKSPKSSLPHENELKMIMTGLIYQRSSNTESDSSCPSPDFQQKNNLEKESVTIQNFKSDKLNLNDSTAKKSKQLSGKLKRNLRKHESYDDTSSVSHGYTTRLSLDKNCKNLSLPLTPPTTNTAPLTPPASGSTSFLSDISNDNSESSKPNKFPVKNEELNTPCDTSGDETSSKSTLDLIIPRPKDFEGKNNPFLVLLKSQEDEKCLKFESVSLPLTTVIPGKPVVRAKKRQLSEKDIFIGPNGEVKRRKFRRNRAGNNYTSRQTASKTATVVPARSTTTKDWDKITHSNVQIENCVDYAFQGRRLRQRCNNKNELDSQQSLQIPTKQSPVKQETNINIDDLKTSVNMYFGAINRIATGERFTVKAKRINPKGKVEFLIEWDGPINGMS